MILENKEHGTRYAFELKAPLPNSDQTKVSKATLDVYIRPMGKAFQVANTETEIANLVQQLQSYDLNL
ncbi:MAG: hypothetical protein ACKPER_14690, partial [Dolichospermum sp.]